MQMSRNRATKWLATALFAPLVMFSEAGVAQQQASQVGPITWRMATSWPEKLPVLHEAAADFAQSVTKASGGRLVIELVGPSQHGMPGDLLDAVAKGKFDAAHTTAHYYAKQVPAIDFFTTIPFGLTATENYAWLIEGGGLALFESILAPMGVLPMAVGNSSVQMGGWFAKEIHTPEDLKGVRMRISGFPGRVMARLGASPVGMPIGQIIGAFEAGKIDAAEVVVPALDMALPLEKYAPHQYEPWHEPDAVMHLFVSKQKFDALPEDLQWIVRQSGHAAALRSIARGLDRNSEALRQLEARGTVTRPWPPEVLKALQKATEEEIAAITDPDSKRVVESLLAYKAKVGSYSKRTIGAVLGSR
jgi:TRAP-type mannitol/chloroaromatic compound transport system substrate-binding protein